MRSAPLFAGLALAAFVACRGDVDHFVYGGRAYDPAAECVAATYTPIDIVDAEGAGVSCAPLCVQFGATLYVSTVCPPVPGQATIVSGADPTCAAALAAPTCGEAPATADAGSD